MGGENTTAASKQQQDAKTHIGNDLPWSLLPCLAPSPVLALWTFNREERERQRERERERERKHATTASSSNAAR